MGVTAKTLDGIRELMHDMVSRKSVENIDVKRALSPVLRNGLELGTWVETKVENGTVMSIFVVKLDNSGKISVFYAEPKREGRVI